MKKDVDFYSVEFNGFFNGIRILMDCVYFVKMEIFIDYDGFYGFFMGF